MGQAILGGLFFVLLGAGMAWWSLRKWKAGQAQAAAAAHWPEATALVEAAGIHSDRNGSLPWIKYRFEVAGRSFAGNRLMFGSVATRFNPAARALVAPYPAGSRIKVRYNSQDPRENVVEARHRSGGMFIIALIGAAAFLLGVVFFVLAAVP